MKLKLHLLCWKALNISGVIGATYFRSHLGVFSSKLEARGGCWIRGLGGLQDVHPAWWAGRGSILGAGAGGQRC